MPNLQELESQTSQLHSKLLDDDDFRWGEDETVLISYPSEEDDEDDCKEKKVKLILRICYITRHILGATVWISTTLFAIFVMFQYIISACLHRWGLWNKTIPLYNKNDRYQGFHSFLMMIHFCCISLILLLGNLQMLKCVRKKYISVHRWSGRIYITCAFLTGIAGTIFSLTHGTVDGVISDIAFSLYGIIVMICSSLTFYHIRVRKDIDTHQRWATRTYASLLGSWIFRLIYGLRKILTGRTTSDHYQGVFAAIIDFGFYIFPLMVAEAYLRSERPQTILMSSFLAIIIILAIILVAGTTGYLTFRVWIPFIKNHY